jgi:hypothetical protein
MTKNSLKKYADFVLVRLNRDFNRNTLPKKDFDLYEQVMIVADGKLFREIVFNYGIEKFSTLHNYLTQRWIRENYGDGKNALVGDTIRLIEMPEDPNPIPPNTIGVVRNVETLLFFGEDHISVDWVDSNRSLNLINGIDKYEVIRENNIEIF